MALMKGCHALPTNRSRDVLPSPSVETFCIRTQQVLNPHILLYSNMTLAALNYLDCDMKLKKAMCLKICMPSAIQISVIAHIVHRVEHVVSRLQGQGLDICPARSPFTDYEVGNSSKYTSVDGHKIDLPEQAGTCDPSVLLPPHVSTNMLTPTHIFPDIMPSPMYASHGSPEERMGYARLVDKQLFCGKVRLRLKVKGCGRVFAVPEPGKDVQREVWNGSVLSAASCRPVYLPRAAAHPQPARPADWRRRANRVLSA